MSEEQDRLLDICRKVTAEHDKDKLASLIQDMNSELEERPKRKQPGAARPGQPAKWPACG